MQPVAIPPLSRESPICHLQRLDYGNGDNVQYTYDNKGRLTQETYEDGATVKYTYDNDGVLSKVQDSTTGGTVTYYYDLTGRMVKYTDSRSGTTQTVAYTYNTENNLTKRTQSVVTTVGTVNRVSEYGYNNDNQLNLTIYWKMIISPMPLLFTKEMIHLKSKKATIPVAVKILIILGAILLFALIRKCLLQWVYCFPRDSLSNYPGTHWKCDKLEMELFVDESGKISGNCEIDSNLIVLDATSYASTTYHSNYIECINRADNTQSIYLHCFYRNVEDDVFYVIVDSTESTLDLNSVADIVPYKFEKQIN